MPPQEHLDFTPFEIVSGEVLGVKGARIHEPSWHSRRSQNGRHGTAPTNCDGQ